MNLPFSQSAASAPKNSIYKRFPAPFLMIALLTGTAFLCFAGQIYNLSEAGAWSFALILAVFAFSFGALVSMINRLRRRQDGLLRDLAEKEREFQSLLESERNLTVLFENANDIIFTTDLAGYFTSLNKIGELTTGYTREEAKEINFTQIVVPEHRKLISRMFKQRLEFDKSARYEAEITTKNGRRVCLEINSRLIVEDSKAVGVQGIARDISQNKRAAEHLRKSEQYQNLFRHANDAILIFEPENEIILEANDRACKIYGRRREDFIGRSLKEVTLNPERGTEALKKLLAAGSYEEFESVHLRGDGAPIHFLINGSLIEYQGKTAILSISRDISARKQIEENLRESEERFRCVTRSVRDAIVSADSYGNIVFWNKGAERIFGYAEHEITGRPLQLIIPAAQQNDSENCADFVENPLDEKTIEAEGLRRDGTKFPLEFSLGNWQTAEGKFVTAVVRDITARKWAQEKIRNSEEWLKVLLDASRDGILVEDEGVIVYINQSYTRLLKYDSAQDLIGRCIADILPPREAKRLNEFGQSRLRGENPPSVYHFTALCRDGTTVEVEGAVSTCVIGGKKYIMTAIRDLTDRRITEKLRESVSLLTSTFEATTDGLLVVDLNNEITTFNEVFIKMWEIPAGIVETMRSSKVFPWICDRIKNPEEFICKSERSVSAPEESESSTLELKDGRIYERHTHPQKLDGKVIGRVVSFRDVTVRKQAEKALRESEYKLRTLLDSMSDGMLQVDNNEVIEFVNDRFCEMTGYARAEVLGRMSYDFLYDEEGREFIGEANRMRSKGVAGQYELKLRKKSGEALYTIVGGVPIVNAADEVTGTMGVFTDITERKRVEEQLVHDAFHDGLTGLANRALFMDHLRLAIERRRSPHRNAYAVLFLDFDRFKVINDSLGHAEGDNLLEQIARRLENSTRAGDLAARLGGDEFVILLSELCEENDAVQVAERILQNLKKPFHLSGNEIFITASIGIALSAAGHKRAEDMLRDADIAMYRAKSKGKAQYQIFDREMHEHASQLLSLETEMRRALERRDFRLYYQPIVDLESETIVGFEALARWHHKTRGFISPDKFIPAAEENGLILPLGSWILQESCRQMREWQENFPEFSHLKISVNLSLKQFSQPDLAEQIAAAVKEANLDPASLKLELTESHVMENSEQAIAIMNELRALGVELSLDDFGTGYSSLSCLPRLPVNFLKIDRSFVTQMTENKENREIISTIIKLAQSLKMNVVAEGIETAEQLAHLKNLGCGYGQGYHFAKPLEAKDAAALIGSLKNNYPLNPVSGPAKNLELIG